MTEEKREILQKLEYLNEKIKLLEKQKLILKVEYEKLSYDLINEINNEEYIKTKKVVK